MRIGVAAIARPTFDVSFAADAAQRAFAVVDTLPGVTTVGPRDLILDEADLEAAVAALAAQPLDGLLVLQASFADSTLAAALADATDAPVTLWAFPEDRTGGRLRLNSLCGINLAAFVLAGRDLRYLYLDPSDPHAAATLTARLAGTPLPEQSEAGVGEDAPPGETAHAAARTVVARLAEARIGIVGDHPTGFEPCRYDAASLAAVTGVTAETIPLPRLFARAAGEDPADVAAVRTVFATHLGDLDELDQDALAQSTRLHLGLLDLARERHWDALATRCWPECFTEFGGAACAPQSLLNQEHGLPALCEADAYGAVTSLVLQWLGGGPSFVADLIHLEPDDNTAVFWHCGLAPMTMADPEATAHAGIHSNRKLPLLYEFPLRPGRITIARLSQSRGEHRLVVGGGEMLRAPLPFSGTAGVARLDHPVGDVLATIMEEGLEHHYGIVYGDVRAELRALAAELDLALVAL